MATLGAPPRKSRETVALALALIAALLGGT
jgi:hypothetical protein